MTTSNPADIAHDQTFLDQGDKPEYFKVFVSDMCEWMPLYKEAIEQTDQENHLPGLTPNQIACHLSVCFQNLAFEVVRMHLTPDDETNGCDATPGEVVARFRDGRECDE